MSAGTAPACGEPGGMTAASSGRQGLLPRGEDVLQERALVRREHGDQAVLVRHVRRERAVDELPSRNGQADDTGPTARLVGCAPCSSPESFDRVLSGWSLRSLR